ncbi:MAG: PQQ-dependent sugar dehydrogenase [Chitinophagales bacterium]
MKTFILYISLCFTLPAVAQPVLHLEPFATNIPNDPIGLVNSGDERLFAVCQNGYIMIIDTDGNVLPEPFLDIDDRVESIYNAHGLLGLVFHPDYASNGYFYVNYINNDQNTVISRFQVSADDPDIADAGSEMILMVVEQPYRVHKGGDMQFGPDGYLYFPLGDGGTMIGDTIGDPDNRAQNPNTLLGKMIRIDVDGAVPYAIPETNPFVDAVDTLHEIWAMGMRNPWRFSFDKLTGDMWIADVGHNLWEEIDFEPAGFAGGRNYGWRCYEGDVEYNFDSCDATVDYTFPIFTYPHDIVTGGYSVTGGYVYRGEQFPNMYGKYFFCDYVSANFFSLQPDGAGGWMNSIYPLSNVGIVAFGEDVQGELYCVNRDSAAVYKLIDLCADLHASYVADSTTCPEVGDGSILLTAEGGAEPYTFEWSNGGVTADQEALFAGVYTVTITDSLGCHLYDTIQVFADTIPAPPIMLIGMQLYAGEGESFQWYQDGVALAGETNAYFTLPFDVGGIFYVEITYANGCTVVSESYEIESAITSAATNGWSISPNPTDGILHIECPDVFLQNNAHILVRDVHGALIRTIPLQKEMDIDLHALPEGLYFVSPDNPDHLIALPVVLQK